MAVRPIDGNELYRIEKLLDTDIIRQDKVALNLLEQVLYDIRHIPTLTPPNEPCPDGSGETALVVLGKLYNTSSLEGAGLDLEEYIMGETLNNPTGNYKVYRRPPEGEDGDATRG